MSLDPLADFAALAERQQRTAHTTAGSDATPIALVLITAVYQCHCGCVWPAPQPGLTVRYDKGPNSQAGMVYLRKNAASFLGLPREHKRVIYEVAFCERCFDADQELGSSVARQSNLRAGSAAITGDEQAGFDQLGNQSSIEDRMTRPHCQLNEKGHSELDRPSVPHGRVDAAVAAGEERAAASSVAQSSPALHKCLGDSRNKCATWQYCRAKGCQFTQASFAGARRQQTATGQLA